MKQQATRNMTQADFSSNSQTSPLIKAARHASELVDLFLSSKSTRQVLSIASRLNEEYDCLNSFKSQNKGCSTVSNIDLDEFEQLDVFRKNCQIQILKSLEILDEALQNYKYVMLFFH